MKFTVAVRYCEMKSTDAMVTSFYAGITYAAEEHSPSDAGESSITLNSEFEAFDSLFVVQRVSGKIT